HLEAQTGCALHMRAGERLEVIDVEGQQVADLAIFAQADLREYFSPGRTLDYNSRINVTTGARLYSNRSHPLMVIEADAVKVHDYLLTPCSSRMFEILHASPGHPSCHENLVRALGPFGIQDDDIHGTFNAFMRVDIALDGTITVGTPPSRAGDSIVFRAETDVLVALTACSSEHTNNGRCKAVAYRVF
ncbi:MAG: urea carboxylase-associated family protein, partial [Candidatus Eremiobacteraeota bacterium]|nr:urea carboxylase-associated family protein [Candidatus Eremiobacteraeota bacterium]